MSGKQIVTVATSIRRRLAAAARERRGQAAVTRGLGSPPADTGEPPRDPGAYRADDARLDALRGDLVHALDRLAAADQDCSAGFRRV